MGDKIKKTLFITGAILLAWLGIYASVHAQMTVPQGGTGKTGFPQNAWIYADNGGLQRLQASSSPTVGYINSTSTATSTFQGGISAPQVCLLGSPTVCLGGSSGSGNSFAFPFDPQSWGNSTTTILGFLNGFLSNASSTVNAPLRLTGLTGLLYGGTGGLVGTTATTAVTCTGTVICSAFTVLGPSPITINGSAGTSASSTLLSDNNSFTGKTDTFTNASTSLLTLLGNLYDINNSKGTNGFVLMSNASGVQWVATTTFGTGLTYSNGSVTCNTASGSIFGCLATPDFSRFNSATSTFSAPLVYTLGTNAVTCPTCNTSGATVSSVATNNGLTGGTITTTGTLGLDLTKIVNGTLLIYNGSQLQATGTPSFTAGYFIGTTTASSSLQGPISYTYASSTATSTLSGINLPYGGCVAVNGVCLTNNTGTVTSVGLSTPNASLSIGSTPVTTSGTITADLNLNHRNDWLALQTFVSASSTSFSSLDGVFIGRTATTSIVGDNSTSTFSKFVSFTAASSTATSTLAGINLPFGGCYAVNGTCIGGTGGSGTVTSITFSGGLTTTGSNPITTSGTAQLDLTKVVNGTLLQYNGSQLAATGTPSLTVGYLISTTTSTSTFVGGINITGTDCFAIQSTCLQTFIQNATAYKSAANYATNAVLAGTPTYNNGASGVGATLTELGTGALSVDGAAPSAGQRILVKNEATQANNGVYTVTATGSGIASYVLTRATDFNSSNDVYAGVTVPILAGGTANGDTSWVQTTTGTITIGTTNIAFIESSIGTTAVTSVATNNGLTGGTITTTGTLGLDLSKIVNGTLLMYNGSQLAATGTQALTAGYFIGTTTSTSTLQGPISATYASTTATSTLNGVYLVGGGLRVGTILNCNGTNTLDTDASGNVVCGVDASGSPTGSPSSIASFDASGNLIASSSVTTVGSLIATTTATSTFQGPLIISNSGNLANRPAYLRVGSSTVPGYVQNYLADFIDSKNDFLSTNIWNTSNGTCATADLTVNNDTGSVTQNFGDLGHTSSFFTGSGCTNNPFTAFGYNSTYLYDPTGWMDFAIGSTSSNTSFNWFAGGYAAANQKMILTNGGQLGVGTTTPNAQATFASSTGPQLSVSTGGNNPIWNVINKFGNLFLATSSPLTPNATSTTGPNTGYVEFPANGGCVGCFDMTFIGGINLRNAKLISASTSPPVANVFQDIYTAPTGRRTIWTGCQIDASTLAVPGFSVWVLTSGVRYQLTATTTGLDFSPFILDPGESISMLSANTGTINAVWCNFIEYDASVPVFSARSYAPNTATTTIYTTPSDRSAQFFGTPFTFPSGTINFHNEGATNWKVKGFHVKAGATAGQYNLIQTAITVSARATGFQTVGNGQGVNPTVLSPGDSLAYRVDVDTTGTPSIVWINIMER